MLYLPSDPQRCKLPRSWHQSLFFSFLFFSFCGFCFSPSDRCTTSCQSSCGNGGLATAQPQSVACRRALGVLFSCAWLLSRLGETESLRCLSASSLRCRSAPSAGLEGRRAASPRQLQISYSVTGIAATHQSPISHRLPRKSLGCVCNQTHPEHVRHR